MQCTSIHMKFRWCSLSAFCSVDYLLPVTVGKDTVGVVYRDMEPIVALMDIYDITNKAILCDPSMNPEDLPFRGGPYNRLKILPDHKWDLKSSEWVMMYSNAYYEQFQPKKTHLVPSNYHRHLAIPEYHS